MYNQRLGLQYNQSAFHEITPIGHYSTQGTLDFRAIHSDVATDLRLDAEGYTNAENQAQVLFESMGGGPRRAKGRGDIDPSTPAIGELTPVGDVLLPLLVCAIAYAIRAYIKKRKELAL